MPNFGKAFGRHGNAAPNPSSASSFPPAAPVPPLADVIAARLQTLEQQVRSMQYLSQSMQNLRRGLGLSHEVEEGLVRRGGLMKMVNNIDRDLGKNEMDTRGLQKRIKTKAEQEEVTNLAGRVRVIEEVREIEGRERRAKKEELDKLRYFANMEQMTAAYLARYRAKHGTSAMPPSMAIAATSATFMASFPASAPAASMASFPSFAGIGTSTPRRNIEAGPSTWTLASAPTLTELILEGETEIIDRVMAEAEAS